MFLYAVIIGLIIGKLRKGKLEKIGYLCIKCFKHLLINLLISRVSMLFYVDNLWFFIYTLINIQ